MIVLRINEDISLSFQHKSTSPPNMFWIRFTVFLCNCFCHSNWICYCRNEHYKPIVLTAKTRNNNFSDEPMVSYGVTSNIHTSKLKNIYINVAWRSNSTNLQFLFWSLQNFHSSSVTFTPNDFSKLSGSFIKVEYTKKFEGNLASSLNSSTLARKTAFLLLFLLCVSVVNWELRYSIL